MVVGSLTVRPNVSLSSYDGLGHLFLAAVFFLAQTQQGKTEGHIRRRFTKPQQRIGIDGIEAFCEAWDGKYPRIGESWRTHWPNICTIFGYPSDIRHAIYTTNAIESLNSVIRHATKKRKIFSSDDSARKVIYLAVMNASKKWTMPIQNWRLAMNWFTIHFDDRLRGHL